MNSNPVYGFQQPPIVIDIRAEENGDPVADPEEVTALSGRTVFWSPDSDRPWIVAFDRTDSPFQNGKLVWFGRGKGIHVGGPLRNVKGKQTFKYTLFYQDEGGAWRSRDPIIVLHAPEAIGGEDW